MGNYIFDGSMQVRSMTKQIFINVYSNNNKHEVENMFKKSSKQVWDKWKSIIDKEIK